MTFTVHIRPVATAITVALMLIAAGGGYLLGRHNDGTAGPDRIGAYIDAHPGQIQKIAGAYLRDHPETLTDMLAGLLKKDKVAEVQRPEKPAAVDTKATIARNADALFRSPHQTVLGNPAGDVTLVEFFDYNCGFCKRALADTMTLLRDDPKLRIVLKEFPILGSNSVDVAHVAVAVRMQDPTGKKYLTFHRRMLESHGGANRKSALDVAATLGLDMKKLKHDMASAETGTSIDESNRLAGALAVSGTPTYVVGDRVLEGAIGAGALEQAVASVRGQTTSD
jgi:protein-disulfide isomerase